MSGRDALGSAAAAAFPYVPSTLVKTAPPVVTSSPPVLRGRAASVRREPRRLVSWQASGVRRRATGGSRSEHRGDGMRHTWPQRVIRCHHSPNGYLTPVARRPTPDA